MSDMITTYQIQNIAKLEAKTGHSWTEFVTEGAGVADLSKTDAITALKGLMGAAGITKKAPLPVSHAAKTGQSGRCIECGANLNHLSAGGYCFDCQS